MGKRGISAVLAVVLAFWCGGLTYAQELFLETENTAIEASTGRIEQVSVNMPEVYVFSAGLSENTIRGAEAYIGRERLTLDEVTDFSGTGQGICYYILLDISGSIPDAYFATEKEGILNLQKQLSEKDQLVLCAFGDDVTLAADGNQDEEELANALNELKNRDQETLLFEAIDRVAEMTHQNQEYQRKVLVVLSDGEDFATGKKQSEEALQTLRVQGLPLYAFAIRNTDRNNINTFGEFARSSGGEIRIFDPEEGAQVLTDLADGLLGDLYIRYHADNNMVSNQEENLTLKFPDDTSLTYTFMNNRWIPDTEAPYLLESEVISERQIELTFSEPLLGAEVAANYQLICEESATGISSVTYDTGDQAVLMLTLSEPLRAGEYELICSNITDVSMEKNSLENTGTVTAENSAQGVSVVSFTIEESEIPVESPVLGRPGADISGLLFLIFCALIVAIILIVVMSRKKKYAEKPMNEEPSVPDPVRPVQEVAPADDGFRQHVAIPHSGKKLQVWLDAPGMQTCQTTWEIGSSLIVGRASLCDITIDDRSMSAQHFCLEHTGNNIYLIDLNSTNGTSLNGIRINQKRKVESGSVIEAGTVKFTVRW